MRPWQFAGERVPRKHASSTFPAHDEKACRLECVPDVRYAGAPTRREWLAEMDRILLRIVLPLPTGLYVLVDNAVRLNKRDGVELQWHDTSRVPKRSVRPSESGPPRLRPEVFACALDATVHVARECAARMFADDSA